MKPVNFKQSNGSLLGGPKETYDTELDVGDLPVCRTGNEVISCWELTWKERLIVLFLGQVWLRVHTQESHPPLSLDVGKIF